MNAKFYFQTILKKDKFQSRAQTVDVFWIQMNADLSIHVKEENRSAMMEVVDETLILIFVLKRLNLQNLLDFA